VRHVVCVSIHSEDHPFRVDADGVGTWKPTCCASARGIERSEGSVFSPEEAVTHEIYVIVGSGNLPLRVDTGGISAFENACASARGVERDDSAVAGAQEAVSHGIYVIVVSVASRARPCPADREGGGACQARDIECRESAVSSPEEAVTHGICVNVGSRNPPLLVDAVGISALEKA